MEKPFYNFLRFFLLMLAGAVVFILTVRVVQANHVGPTCVNSNGKDYCNSASRSFSGSGPTFTGNVTVSQPIPPLSEGLFCPKLGAFWQSPNLGVQLQQVPFGESSPCSDTTTTVTRSFSFSGIAAGDNFFEGAANIWWWNGTGFILVSTLNTPMFLVNIPSPLPLSPSALSSSCPAPGTSATVSWGSVSDATSYALRADDTINSWNGLCNGGQNQNDVCLNVTNTFHSFSSSAGHNYNWWVHACNSSGCSSPSVVASFTCALPSPPTISSFTVSGSGGQGPAQSITVPVGTVATINWSSNADSCSSDGSLGTFSNLAPSGVSSPLTLDTPTTGFQDLTCKNAGGSSPTSRVNITVLALPRIDSFTASDGAGQTGPNITIPIGTAITLNWSTSNTNSCSSNGDLGKFPSVPLQGPSVSLTPTKSGSQTLTCTNLAGSDSKIVNVTVLTPPTTAPVLSISPSPVKTTYVTDEPVTISWTTPPGTTFFSVLMGGVTPTFAGCTSGLGCQPTLDPQLSGAIGGAFTIGTGRFIKVYACNAVGCNQTPSNTLTFNISPPAQTVNYTIKQAPASTPMVQTIFPMSIGNIDPPSAQIVLPNRTVQLTLWYSQDGTALKQAVTSGITWTSNNPNSISVNSSGLVTAISFTNNQNFCTGGSIPCVSQQADLGTARIQASYRDRVYFANITVSGTVSVDAPQSTAETGGQ